MPRSNVITTAVNAAARTVSFKVGERPALVLDLSRVSGANVAYAALHGFKQRIADAGALERTDQDGRLIPAQELEAAKFAKMSALVEHYHSGSEDWSTRREGSGTEGGLLLRSLVAAGVDMEQARAKIESWSRSEQLAVLNSDKIRPYADEIRAQSGKGIDAGKLLEGIL